MKKSTRPLLATLVILTLFFSCGKKKDTTGLLIPKDAIMVLHLNGNSLNSKLDWKEITATKWFQKIYHESSKDSIAMQLLDNPENSGINIHSDVVFFLQKSGKKSYIVFEGKLKDKATFESFISKAAKMKPTEDNGTWNVSHGLKAALTWNTTHFAYVCNVPIPSMNPMSRGPRGMEEEVEEPAASTGEVKKMGKEILSLSPSQTLGTDDRFATLVHEEGDIHFWMDPERLYGDGVNPYMSMMKMSSLLKGNISAMTLNFENGKITLKSKQYYGSELSGLFKKYTAKEVKASLINRLPSQDILAIMAFNISPEGLQDFLTITGMEGVLNMMMAKMNYSIEDFIKGNKGEGLVAVTDVNIPSFGMEGAMDTAMLDEHKPMVKMLFATAINDKKAFERLVFFLESAAKKGGKSSSLTYKMNNEWFVAGTATEDIDKFMAGANNKLAIADAISGYPIGGYINLQKMMKIRPTRDSAGVAAMTASANMWQDIIFKGGIFKNGAMEFTAEANLVNKTENSLKQLNRYIEQMATIYEERIDRMRKMKGWEKVPSDTTFLKF